MAMTVTAEKVLIPSPGDTYGYMAEQRQMAASQRTIVQVADRTEADAVAAAMATDGRPVSDSNPLFVYNISTRNVEIKDGSGWRGNIGTNPFGHMGKTNGFTGGTDQYPVTGMAAQVLRGGVTFDSATNSLVVPLTGLYKISGRGYTSGGQNGGVLFQAMINVTGGGTGCSAWWTKGQVDEFQALSTVVRSLTAGDKISMRAQQPASTWGSSGYDGCFLEVEYIGS